jgi:hypothetical protein
MTRTPFLLGTLTVRAFGASPNPSGTPQPSSNFAYLGSAKRTVIRCLNCFGRPTFGKDRKHRSLV